MDVIAEMRKEVNYRIQTWQNVLREIETCEDLHLGKIDREFMDNDFLQWFREETETNKHVSEKLSQLPFEQAYSYKNPEFYTKSHTQLLQHVFGDESFEWRDNPTSQSNLSITEKYRLIKRFEYMCYYVINTREELLYDICEYLGSKHSSS